MKSRLFLLLILGVLLAACGESEQPGETGRTTAVSTIEVKARQVEQVERSVGRLRASTAPSVVAETAGRVTALHADAGDHVQAGDLLAELDDELQRAAVSAAEAEISRLVAVLENERRRVRRLSELAELQSVAQDQLDEAQTGVAALEAQLQAAEARLVDAEYSLERTQITSPVSGHVQSRLISNGDYVSPGDSTFALVADAALRAWLPLPEHLQDQVGVGQAVVLHIPARPDQQLSARVSEVRPAVGEGSRAIELIVDLDNHYGWRSGGSVSAEIILQQREGLVVPLASVVHRPAGSVVYVLDGRQVNERPVMTGLRGADFAEIIEGVESGEQVVVDGAGFLTDGALVSVEQRDRTP